MWVLLILILFVGAQATSVEVRTCAELRDALEDAAIIQVIVAATVVHVENWPVLRISRAVSIHGIPGATIDFQKADQPLLFVDAAGVLRLSSLILANAGPGVSGTSESLQNIINEGGKLYFTDVVFYSSRHGALSLRAGDEIITAEASKLQEAGGDQPIVGTRAWRLDDASTDASSLTSCSAVLDAQNCYTAGSALAFDSASLHAAVSHPGVSSIKVVQDITVQPEHCNSRQPVFVDRLVSITSCPGAVLSFSRLDSCWSVSSGGLLQLGQGLQLSHTASHRSSSSSSEAPSSAASGSSAVFNPYAALLLPAVTMVDGGAVEMQDTGVQLPSDVFQQLRRLQNQAIAEAVAAPVYRFTGSDSIKVLEWHIVAPYAGQQQKQKHAQLLGAAPSAPQQQQLVASSRRLLLQHPRSLQDHQQQQQPGAVTAVGVTMDSRRQLMARVPAEQNRTSAEQNRTSADPNVHPAVTAANSHWKLQNQAALAEKYPRDRCFSDFRFLAKDITQFVRLIKDPATRNIELTGNIVFTEELFPPANANNQSLGINITHQLTIRACTGDPNNPIIVDVNNLQQQIYVYGEMRWEGNIRFINSFPSPRRAGLFPMISVLSVEGDGVIWFEDIHIHGNEPCPLFDLNDPFWDRYGQSPLSAAFVPGRDDFELVSDREILLFNWTFNKTAWVLNSQGSQGVVKAVGDAYWQWVDVLVTWAPDAPGPQAPGMVAAIVVPIVVVCVVASALGFFFWRRRRTAKEASVAKQGAGYFISQDSQIKAGELGGMSITTGTAVGLHQASTIQNSVGSRTENSKSSYKTQELIEEARRRMQDTGRKEASIVLEGLLGEGTFGKVYRGVWQGTTVAVKTMLFPAAMSGKEKREKMVVMETAISSSLSHPNIVQTYTYVVKPLTGELAMQAMDNTGNKPLHGSNGGSEPSSLMGSELGENHGWEVRLVLELCDRGSLKELLNAGGLHKPDGKPDMAAIVATALDVARAMLHLHSENIIHSDLKARNVLLKSAGSDVRGFVAKVSDFGLSVRMDPTETHVSNVYQGTLTHMAPEVLMYGKVSRASDVYAFGILMWELYTAEHAFKGTPRVLLGHEVTKMGIRPEFPRDCPFDYQLLACRCWESDPAIRPTFQQIMADLQRMASKLSMVDSASSLPMPAQQQAACTSQVQTASSAVMGTTHTAAAGPLHAAAVGGIDPTKLHNWEPQTSLLDLQSVYSTQGSSQRVASAVGAMSQTNDFAPHVPNDLSWGTQSAGGLWLGGEFAPSDMPSDVQLPVHGGSDHIEQAAAGLHPQELAAAVAAAARQQQARQQEAAVAGAPSAGHMRGQGLAGPAGVLNLQQQQQQLLQHQQLHAHHGFVTDIRRPEDLQEEKQRQQQQQQLPYAQILVEPSTAESNSLSSTGVYLDDGSSTMPSGFTDSSSLATAGGAACGDALHAAAGRISQQHSNMATIVEEGEAQAASADS